MQGSGSRRPKNMWIRWIRIRNTGIYWMYLWFYWFRIRQRYGLEFVCWGLGDHRSRRKWTCWSKIRVLSNELRHSLILQLWYDFKKIGQGFFTNHKVRLASFYFWKQVKFCFVLLCKLVILSEFSNCFYIYQEQASARQRRLHCQQHRMLDFPVKKRDDLSREEQGISTEERSLSIVDLYLSTEE